MKLTTVSKEKTSLKKAKLLYTHTHKNVFHKDIFIFTILLLVLLLLLL